MLLRSACLIVFVFSILFVACEDEAVDPNEGMEGINTINRFRFANTTNDSVAVLVDGTLHGNNINDMTFTSTTAAIDLEDINNSDINNELMAFHANRVPLIFEGINWHSNLDTTLIFEDPVTLPITGWVIYIGDTTFEYIKYRIERAMQDCNRIYAHEGTGIQFDLSIIDVSSRVGINQHYDISTARDMIAVSNFLEIENDRLNLFFTQTVAGDRGNAFTTFFVSGYYDNRIAFGLYAVDGGTIAHEIGHTFTLVHYDPEITGPFNVMVGFTPIRVFFTEGQIYQMWFNTASATHTVYHLPIRSRMQNSIFSPNTYLSAWDDKNTPPYFDLYDNDEGIE